MKRIMLSLFLIAVNIAFTGLARAATTTANLSVSATVPNVCTVSTTGVNFGTVDPAFRTAVNNNGSINVNCSSGAPYTVALGPGLHPNAVTGALTADFRFVSNGAAIPNFISYGLFQDSALTIPWGDGTTATNNGKTASGTGSGLEQNLTVSGQLPTTQPAAEGVPPPGTYNDTVLVTVNF